MNRTQSRNHRIGTYKIKKKFSSCFDDKIYIQSNRYDDGLTLNNYSEFFLSSFKNIILIFSLVRTGFLATYKNIILIFPLVRKASLSSYKNIFLILSLIRAAFSYFFVSAYIVHILEG